uniref:Late nodulin domain-containing protein n=1 Tax=Medicago truncatula TaxID=3880 RepID=I3SB20_MEDTR|nr:unknown [Medicago truncatula]
MAEIIKFICLTILFLSLFLVTAEEDIGGHLECVEDEDCMEESCPIFSVHKCKNSGCECDEMFR